MSLRSIRMPNAGIMNGEGGLNKAGHHYLQRMQEVPVAVADLQDQIDAVGTLGTLAGLSSVSRENLATGFGWVLLRSVEVDAETAVLTCATNTPGDDTIPQIGEGNEVLSGVYTPLSTTSQLRISIQTMVGPDGGGTRDITLSLFQDAGADAIAAIGTTCSAAKIAALPLEHWIASTGADVTLQVNLGSDAGAAYLNGPNAARRYGGVCRSFLRVDEFEAH